MEMSTREAAQAFGITDQRVRAMIADGSLEARRIGSRWLVDSAVLQASRRSGRAMTAANAWRFLALTSGQEVNGLRPEETYRLRQRLARLLESRDPALLLRTWLARRATRLEFEAGSTDSLIRDERLMLSGISDDRSGLTTLPNEAEAYVMASNLRPITRDNTLFRTARGTGNVVLHVVDDAHADRMRPSLLLTAADLSERTGVREQGQVKRLVDSLASQAGNHV